MWKTYHLIKVSLSAALAGIICCIGPVVLFQFGLMSGVYAISFADFFYAEDGSIGTGAIILRVIGLFIVIIGVIIAQRKSIGFNFLTKKKSIKFYLQL